MAASTTPQFFGGLVLEAPGRVGVRNLALPVPWYAYMHASKIDQVFEDGLRAMLPLLSPRQLAYAEGTAELLGLKTWLLTVVPGGPVACIVTNLEWPARGAHRLLMQMLADPRGVIEAPTFLRMVPPVDAIDRVQQSLDVTTGSARAAVAAALERGEKLEALEAKSANISAAASRFHEEARRVNRCCWGLF